MREWMVGLEGHDDVLENLARCFDTDQLRVVQEGQTYYFKSVEFDSMADEDAVRNYMIGFIPTLNGVCKAAIDEFEPVRFSGEVVGIEDDGTRRVFWFVCASTTCFLRGRAEVGDGGLTLTHPTNAENWLTISKTKPEVARLLQMFVDADSWTKLYVILDYIEKDVGENEKDLVKKQVISQEEYGLLKRFTGTANNFQLLGLSARHGIAEWTPPSQPVNLQEAKAIIRTIVTEWLRWKCKG